MRMLGRTIGDSKKVKQAQGFDSQLSQVVEVNGKYRLFLRTVKVEEEDYHDIIAAILPGRSCDYDVTGLSFYPLNDFDLSETGQVVDKSGLDFWSRITRVMHKAAYNSAIKKVEREAKNTAEDAEIDIDAVALAKLIECEELTYFGGKAADGTNIMPKKFPAISGVQIKTCVQVAVVKLNADGSPDFATAKYAIMDVSKKREAQIISKLNNPNYHDVETGYIELAYEYVGKDKQEAGKNAVMEGVARNLSLELVYPELWAKAGKEFVANLRNTPEEVAGRNRNLSTNKTPMDIVSTLKKYFATNTSLLNAISLDDEETKRSARDIIEAGLVANVPKIQKSLLELANELDAERAAKGDVVEDKTEAEEKEEKVKKAAKKVTDKGIKTLSELKEEGIDLDEVAGESPEEM